MYRATAYGLIWARARLPDSRDWRGEQLCTARFAGGRPGAGGRLAQTVRRGDAASGHRAQPTERR